MKNCSRWSQLTLKNEHITFFTTITLHQIHYQMMIMVRQLPIASLSNTTNLDLQITP